MGNNSNKSKLQPLIQLILNSRKLNIYTIPENYSCFLSIAYNFYYAYNEKILPYETLTFSFTSRGFLKNSIKIKDKKSYKNVMQSLCNETIQIIVEVEQ